ncbi:nucleoside-diphosphate kinase [Alloiococcus sp. CFN-8]|uniref:nucleoside-diphosphate kinase n=1 Tax=Alloiococcus sp. CFN-8 TaxID=3416081 RepID=UPI003CF4ED17
MVERSLVLIKPDAVERNLIGKILTIYEDNDLKIVDMKLTKVSRELAEAHYIEHKGRDYYENLIAYITRSAVVAVVLEGEDAIAQVRRLNGKTNPAEAEEGTVRRLYGLATNQNSVHASDSPENAQREIGIWFPGK